MKLWQSKDRGFNVAFGGKGNTNTNVKRGVKPSPLTKAKENKKVVKSKRKLNEMSGFEEDNERKKRDEMVDVKWLFQKVKVTKYNDLK